MTYSTLVTTDDLARHMGDPDWVVADCRYDPKRPGQGHYAYHHGHIPKACYVHLDGHLSAPMLGPNGRHPLPAPEGFSARLGELGICDKTQVVAYDDAGGPYAARLWWMLRWIGHRNVAVLNGGWQRWLAEGREVRAGVEPRAAKAPHPLRPDENAVVDSAYLEQHLGQLAIIDARHPDRMRGMGEDQDPIGGHIPKAINRYFRQNLDPGGSFQSAENLSKDFAALISDHAVASVVHYCGSGVTACHNLLAMEVAGLRGSKLYPGSWSEWCSDPQRPMMHYNRIKTDGNR